MGGSRIEVENVVVEAKSAQSKIMTLLASRSFDGK
jgi:hypothetical protein